MSGFTNAPDNVRAIAEFISGGGVPTAEQLGVLSPEELNASYAVTDIAARPTWGHTLLRQAVLDRNVGAVQALADLGADVRFNDDEMAYLAVRMNDSPQRVWFPDVQRGAAILNIWIAQGGDVNAINRHYGAFGNLLVTTQPSHFEIILLLLENGCDPWVRLVADGDTSENPYYYDNFFETLANAAPIQNEVAFRIAREGHYKPSTQENHDKLMALYELSAESFVGTGGRENHFTVWSMQMALNKILPALGITPQDEVAALLDMQPPEVEAGFWLAPDQIRSPDGDAHAVLSNNQFGQEKWNDH